jgi:hypothetical protein
VEIAHHPGGLMKRFLFALFTILATWNVYAVTAEELERQFKEILQHCEKVGFYRCEEKFQGKNRGVFAIPIEAQKLKITEEEFESFVKIAYKNQIGISFFSTSADYNLDITNQFSVAQFSEIVGMQEMNKEGTIIELKFRHAPRLALVSINNEYKIGVFPEEDNQFKKSKAYIYPHFLRLKNNILRYHMKEAEILEYDRVTLRDGINDALAPIVVKIARDKIPEIYVKVYKRSLKRDAGEVQRFYMPLNTPEEIMQKIKEMHPERKL